MPSCGRDARSATPSTPRTTARCTSARGTTTCSSPARPSSPSRGRAATTLLPSRRRGGCVGWPSTRHGRGAASAGSCSPKASPRRGRAVRRRSGPTPGRVRSGSTSGWAGGSSAGSSSRATATSRTTRCSSTFTVECDVIPLAVGRVRGITSHSTLGLAGWGAAEASLGRADLGGGGEVATGPPRREVALRPHLTAPDPPQPGARGPGQAEVHVRGRVLRVAGVADHPEKLPCGDAGAGGDAGADPERVRAVVADAVVADDRDRSTAAASARVDLRVPAVGERHLVDPAGRDGDERTALLGEDVRRRVVVVAGGVRRPAVLHRIDVALGSRRRRGRGWGWPAYGRGRRRGVGRSGRRGGGGRRRGRHRG